MSKISKEDLEDILGFIKARINESFFPDEKETLARGLKVLNLSLKKYCELQIRCFKEEDLDSEKMPEFNMLTLPNLPISKHLLKIGPLSNSDEVVLDNFLAVQLSLSVITFEYFRQTEGNDVAIEYAKYSLNTFKKMKARIGEKPPACIEEYISNMTALVKQIEEEHKGSDANQDLELLLHYLKQRPKSNYQNNTSVIAKTVHPIHFEDYSGQQFERLSLAHVIRLRIWDKLPEWVGQTGSDGGRDIWAIYLGQSYCYQCANYQKLTFTKSKSDIDKLVKNKTIPNNLIVIAGGTFSNDTRNKIVKYAEQKGVSNTEVWSGGMFEEKLRKETPELIKRFCHGEEFPDSPVELAAFNNLVTISNDQEIIALFAECFDRPAFTTKFNRESSIPDFEQAVQNTIEVLNTGTHRLRDGTVIRHIPSRHKVQNENLKSELATLTSLVIKLRDDFRQLLRDKEIEPCSCTLEFCPTYKLSDKACKTMDDSRNEILGLLQKIKPDFKLTVR